LEDNSRALYVPPPARDRSGHLLFRRGTTLMAQRFDPESLAVEGNPIPLAERIGNSGNVGYGGFAASENGVLLIAEDDRYEAPARMTWLDRWGKMVEVKGEARPYAGLALAPDGKRIATAVFGNTSDIWLEDIHQGAPTRFTFNGNVRQPTWSPRGDFLIFATPTLQGDFYRKASNGEGKEELFFHAGSNAYPNDISGDGKWLVFAEEGDKTKDDLWFLPLEGERKPQTYLQTPFNERNAQFSPDGTWMAYASDESGLFQVYVQPIPATGAKRQVSMKGGSSPRWRRDGAELFYISSEGALMAATVTRGASGVEFGAPRQLFERRLVYGAREFLYQPAADGQKFLAALPEDSGNAPARVIIQMNWQAGLKSRN
jgi:hypothetical protein